MNYVITRHTKRWRFTMRLNVEIDTHIEGVSTHKIGCLELRAQLGVRWGQKRKRRQFSLSLSDISVTCVSDKMSLCFVKSTPLTLRVGLVFKRRRLRPPLKRKVGYFSGALVQQHTAPPKQNPLQLDGKRRRQHNIHTSYWSPLFSIEFHVNSSEIKQLAEVHTSARVHLSLHTAH